MGKLESALGTLPTNYRGIKYLIEFSTISNLSDLICRYNLYGRKSCINMITSMSVRHFGIIGAFVAS